MEQKYYIPDIEDIRVGYECEVYSSKVLEITNTLTNGEFWINKIITNKGIVVWAEELINSKRIRVPYLTKEQIEDEGWKYYPEINKFKHPIDVDLLLHYDFEKHYLWITFPGHLVEQGIKYEANKYIGKCLSINEFRKICKWLNVK